MIKRGITQKTINLSAILIAICLLLSGCGGKSTFDGSRTSDETVFRMEYSILDKEESTEMKLTEGDQIQVHISHITGNVDVIVGENTGWQEVVLMRLDMERKANGTVSPV